MKKVLLMMLAFATISAGLISCSEEDDDDGNTNPPATGCDMCGTYNGDVDGTLRFVPLINSDSTIAMPDVEGVIAEHATDDSKLNLSLTLEISGVPADVAVDVDKDSDTQISITNTTAQVLGTLDLLVTTGTGTYTPATGGLVATINIDDPAGSSSDNIEGTLNYDGTKQ